MKLENHIVNRLLRDENLWVEMIMAQAEKDGVTFAKGDDDAILRYGGMYKMLNNEGNKTYFVTKSVTEKLNLLDTKKCLDAEGWKIFNTLPDFKKTFILPEGNSLTFHRKT